MGAVLILAYYVERFQNHAWSFRKKSKEETRLVSFLSRDNDCFFYYYYNPRVYSVFFKKKNIYLIFWCLEIKMVDWNKMVSLGCFISPP